MTKILVDSGLLEQVASSLDFVATNGVPAGGQEANNAEDLYHQATALRAALSAPQQEAVVFPVLPNTPYCRPDGASLYDAMMMHQYAARYADTHPAPSVPEGDEENQAVRMFLMMYGGKDCTIEQMRRHLECAGYAGCWPEWAANASGHLSKGGAQSWIRHMLSAAPKAQTADDRKDAERFFPFEFEVWQNDGMVASASGPQDTALSEAMHYATQYQQDGPVRVFEVTRTLVAAIAAQRGKPDGL